jgi:hypothetical protein
MREKVLAGLLGVALFSVALSGGAACASVARENGDNRPGATRVMMGDAATLHSKLPASMDQRGASAQG